MTTGSGIDPVELRTGDWLVRPPRPEEATDAFTLVRDPDVAQWNPVPSDAHAV